MPRPQKLSLILLTLLAFLACASLQATVRHHTSATFLVYVGTLTNGTSRGIYAYRFNAATGNAEFLGLAAATPNPMFFVVGKDGRYLYAVNEMASVEGSTVSAFRIDARTGKLTFIDKVSSAGVGPCDLALDRTGKALLVTNCNSGSVALLPVRPDGSLAEPAAVVQHRGSSINPTRQRGPHAHGITVTSDNRFAIVADLGLDKIFLHPMNARTHTLSAGSIAVDTPRGGGVRHLIVHPNGKFLYAIDELDSALTVFRYAHGALQQVEALSALPTGMSAARGGSELQVDPGGHFLYVSVRGDENNVAVFSIDPVNGHLAPLQFISTEGKMPRHFAIDPTGTWLAVANQNSHSITWLQRNAESGRLRPANVTSLDIDSPTCVAFIP